MGARFFGLLICSKFFWKEQAGKGERCGWSGLCLLAWARWSECSLRAVFLGLEGGEVPFGPSQQPGMRATAAQTMERCKCGNLRLHSDRSTHFPEPQRESVGSFHLPKCCCSISFHVPLPYWNCSQDRRTPKGSHEFLCRSLVCVIIFTALLC